MADSHSLPVQSRSPRPSIQISNNDNNSNEIPEALEDEPQVEIEAPPKIDINALKNEILTDGMQVSGESYVAITT